jgi:rhodanese-related sulfurtransferase
MKVIIVGGVAGGASCAARLSELPRDREILVLCRSAQLAYYATRILLQNGFAARNISGHALPFILCKDRIGTC